METLMETLGATLAENEDLNEKTTHIECNHDGKTGRGYRRFCATEE